MKGKTTVRHELKRYDSKKVRAATKNVLNGGHYRDVRTGGWAGKDDRQPPLLDVALKGKKQKKAKKAIDYCPGRKALGEGNKRHYYIEREETVESSHWDGTPYSHTYKWKECMYCNKGNRGGWGWRWWKRYY